MALVWSPSLRQFVDDQSARATRKPMAESERIVVPEGKRPRKLDASGVWLTDSQSRVLDAIRGAGESGLSWRALSESTGAASNGLYSVVQALSRKGLVRVEGGVLFYAGGKEDAW